MSNLLTKKPGVDEHAPYYAKYVDAVPSGNVVETLRGQIEGTLKALRCVSEDGSLRRYAEGKWSLREVVGHVTDAERIFAYRALRFARADAAPLAGFEQDDYVVTGRFDARDWRKLLEELEAVRRSTVLLFEGMDEQAWDRRGVASGNPVSVRALAWIIAGHEAHHMRIVQHNYL